MISLPLRCGKHMSFRIVDDGFHGQRSDSERRIANMVVAVTMMVVATLASLIVFILSVVALQGIYGWYPSFVAQQWFIYDQFFAVFSFFGMAFGAIATYFLLCKKSCWAVLASGIACTISGAGVFVVSLIQPLALLWHAMAYYFLPLFIAPLIGTLIVYVRKDEKDDF
jgi:hypothetical protein